MAEEIVTVNIDVDGKLERHPPQVVEDVLGHQTQLIASNSGVYYNTIEISTDELREHNMQIQPASTTSVGQNVTPNFKFELISTGGDLSSDYRVVVDNDDVYNKSGTEEVVIINTDVQVESPPEESSHVSVTQDHNSGTTQTTKVDGATVFKCSDFTNTGDSNACAIKPKFILPANQLQPIVLTSADGKTYQITQASQLIQFATPSTLGTAGISAPQIYPPVSPLSTFQYVIPSNVDLVRNSVPIQVLNVSQMPLVEVEGSSQSINNPEPALCTEVVVDNVDTGNNEQVTLKEAAREEVAAHEHENGNHPQQTLEEQATRAKVNENIYSDVNANQAVASGSQTQESKMTENTLSYVIPADVPNSSSPNTINVSVPGMPGVVCQLQRFLYTQGLCRVCLLVKSDLINIFEDVNISSTGVIENSRGPHAANKYNLIPALKTLLDVEIHFGDGLPEQICLECIDNLTSFSVFRKRITIGQSKLNEVLAQVKGSATPTVIPELGEVDMRKTDVFRNVDHIIQAKNILKYSSFSHLVVRNISDRVWEKIFQALALMVGFKSGKLKNIEAYAVDPPHVNGWFCCTCHITIHGSIENYRAHCTEVHGVKSPEEVLFPCDVCGSSYAITDRVGNTQPYGEHWLQHFFFFECSDCSRRMPSQKGLWVHRRSAHKSGGKIFHCTLCDKSFSKKAHLHAHQRTHMNPEERKQHLNWCKICGKGLTSSLTAHIASVHSTDRPWKCEMCNKQFKRKEILNGHRETVHFNMRKYQCELCGEYLKSHSTKALHLLRHTGEKPHACPVCDKRFYSAHSMKSHMLKHRDVGDIKCTVCGKDFKRKIYLVEHMRLHTGEKPHGCHICGKQIRMKSNFFKHMKVHKRREAGKIAKDLTITV